LIPQILGHSQLTIGALLGPAGYIIDILASAFSTAPNNQDSATENAVRAQIIEFTALLRVT